MSQTAAPHDSHGDHRSRGGLTSGQLDHLIEQPAEAPIGGPSTVLVATGSAELYGSDRMMYEAVVGLIGRGHRVVVAFGASGPMVDRVREAGAEVLLVPVPVVRRAYLTPKGLPTFGLHVALAIPRLRGVMRDVAPDVVYVNTLTLPAWVAAGRAMRTPTVLHVHEAEATRHRVVRTGVALPITAADTVIFNSRHSRDVAMGDLGRLVPPATVIPNGVPVDEDAPPVRDALEGPVRVIYVGRLSPRKGVDVAVDAIALLRDAGVDVHLDLVGEVFEGYEWYRTDLEQRIVERDLGDHVTMHGFHPAVRDFVRQADIAIAPTRRDEPFGNVLIEGVGAGRPFVASSQPGLMEAGRGLRSVTFSDPGDPRSLADAIRDHIDHWPQRRAAAQEAALEVGRRHAPDLYRTRVSSVIEATRVAYARRSS